LVVAEGCSTPMGDGGKVETPQVHCAEDAQFTLLRKLSILKWKSTNFYL